MAILRCNGETDAFRNAGRQSSYRKLIMVTTLAPCWYLQRASCRQFGFSTVIVGREPKFPRRRRLAALARSQGDRSRLTGMRLAIERVYSRESCRLNEDVGLE